MLRGKTYPVRRWRGPAPLLRHSRRFASQAINVGQRPMFDVAPVYSRLTSNNAALLTLLQERFTLQDPRHKYILKHRGPQMRWVRLERPWRYGLSARRMDASSF